MMRRAARCVQRRSSKAYTDRKLDAIVEEDWRRDSKGEITLDREGFLMSWFQISDRWQHLHSDETAPIKPDAETYAYFLQDLIECCMTHPDDQGKRAWRDERDVWKLEEYRSTLSKTEKKGADFMDAATAEMKAQLDAAVARERIVWRKAGTEFCHEAATECMCNLCEALSGC